MTTPASDPVETQVTITSTDENGNTVYTGYPSSSSAVYEGEADDTSGGTPESVPGDPDVSEGA